jgi:hypothetical protein
MCHHLRLIHMAKERVLLVPVVVGQQEMRLKRKMMVVMVMMVRRGKKYLMCKKSILLTMCTWEVQFFGCPRIWIGWRKSATRAKQF